MGIGVGEAGEGGREKRRKYINAEGGGWGVGLRGAWGGDGGPVDCGWLSTVGQLG